ncbi:Gp49 family protein [Burkholderia gladioli]|uniref:Gp49 family protein n=1 Tax=Burkholderia gladioli TaxID=28095 RepID=UPI001EEEF224
MKVNALARNLRPRFNWSAFKRDGGKLQRRRRSPFYTRRIDRFSDEIHRQMLAMAHDGKNSPPAAVGRATRSRTMNDNDIEREIRAKGKTAARVTPADIEASIEHEVYFTAAEGVAGESIGKPSWISPPSLALLTFCVLVLRNGFTVTGESACASPENFDAEIGRKIARQNAVAKIWRFEGYLLKQRLYEER